jgi:hypothetical protein
VTVRLITLSLRQVLRLLLLTCRSSRSKDLELLVLRQELAVLRRQVPHLLPLFYRGSLSILANSRVRCLRPRRRADFLPRERIPVGGLVQALGAAMTGQCEVTRLHAAVTSRGLSERCSVEDTAPRSVVTPQVHSSSSQNYQTAALVHLAAEV